MMAAITLTNLQIMAAGAPLLAPLKVDLTDPNLQPGADAPEWEYDAAQDTFPRWVRARAVTIHWAGCIWSGSTRSPTAGGTPGACAPCRWFFRTSEVYSFYVFSTPGGGRMKRCMIHSEVSSCS